MRMKQATREALNRKAIAKEWARAEGALRVAIEALSNARIVADRMAAQGGPDDYPKAESADLAARIAEIISSDNGESGLSAIARSLKARI